MSGKVRKIKKPDELQVIQAILDYREMAIHHLKEI